MASAIDPIALAVEARKIVGSGEERKYYRFRPARSDSEDFEKEELILYHFVLDHLRKAGLSYSI